MNKIKVTGYLAVDDIDPEHVDLSNSTGLSEAGYEAYSEEIELEELHFELELG